MIHSEIDQTVSTIPAIILAAGQGKRMGLEGPKVMRELNGKPILEYVLESISQKNIGPIYVIIGRHGKSIRDYFGKKEMGLIFLEQDKPLGTGDAVLQAAPYLQNYPGTILVLNGDAPLIRPRTIQGLITKHQNSGAVATLLVAHLEKPAGYGRIIRDIHKSIVKIIEESDATPSQQAMDEVNAGLYCFEAEPLFSTLQQLEPNPKKGEYYLTDVIRILRKKNQRTRGYPLKNVTEMYGINTIEDLKVAGEILNQLQKPPETEAK